MNAKLASDWKMDIKAMIQDLNIRPIRRLDNSNWSLWPSNALTSKTPNGGYLLSIGVKIKNIRNLDKLYIKFKLLITWLQKRVHEVIWPQIEGIWGQNQNIFKPWHFIYQNEEKETGAPMTPSEARG